MGYLQIKNIKIDRDKNKITFKSTYNNDSEPFVEDEFGSNILDFDDKYAKLIYYLVTGSIQCVASHELQKLNCAYTLLENYTKDYCELGPLGTYRKYEKEIINLVGNKLDINAEKAEDQYIGGLDLDTYILEAVHDEMKGLNILNDIYPNNILLNRFIRDKFTYIKDLTDENEKKYIESKKAFEEKYDIVGEVEEVRSRTENLKKFLKDFEVGLIKYGNGKQLFDSFPDTCSVSECRKDVAYGGVTVPIEFQNGRTSIIDSIFIKDQNRDVVLYEGNSIWEIIESTIITDTEEIEFLYSRIRSIDGQYEEIEEEDCI